MKYINHSNNNRAKVMSNEIPLCNSKLLCIKNMISATPSKGLNVLISNESDGPVLMLTKQRVRTTNAKDIIASTIFIFVLHFCVLEKEL